MKVLVTGGSGFIGTNLIEELVKETDQILNIDIRPPNLDAHLPWWSACDILDRERLISEFQAFMPDYVIHLAARTDTSSNDLADYVVNIAGTENVLAAAKVTGSIERVIITSTQFVNQFRGIPKDDFDFAPHTTYGESKVLNEKAVRQAHLKCTWTIIRPTNIWGPWHPRYPYEFWKVLGSGLYFHPDGERVIRAYGYVKNVVFQMLKMIEVPSERVNKKVYYVGDEPIDLLDWVNGFSIRQTGRKVRLLPRGLIRTMAYIGDALSVPGITFPITTSRYRSMTISNDAPMEPTFRAFGQPPWSLSEGIDQTVGWLRDVHPGIVRN